MHRRREGRWIEGRSRVLQLQRISGTASIRLNQQQTKDREYFRRARNPGLESQWAVTVTPKGPKHEDSKTESDWRSIVADGRRLVSPCTETYTPSPAPASHVRSGGAIWSRSRAGLRNTAQRFCDTVAHRPFDARMTGDR